MKAKWIVAGLALASVVALAVRLQRQAAADRAETAARIQENDVLRLRMTRGEARLQMRKVGLAARGAPVAAPRSPGDNVIAENAPAAAPVQPVNALAQIANDPAKMAEYSRNYRATLDLEYGAVFKALRLSPVTIEKFKDVELKLEQTRLDLHAAIANQRLDPNGPTARRLWDDYARSRNQPKIDLLGDQHPAYFEFYRTWGTRYYAQQLAGAAVITGELPSAAQIDRAAEILVAHTQRRGSPSQTMPRWTEPHTTDWPAAKAQLQALLSPGQLEMLETWLARDKLQRAIGQHTARLTAQFRGQPAPK